MERVQSIADGVECGRHRRGALMSRVQDVDDSSILGGCIWLHDRPVSHGFVDSMMFRTIQGLVRGGRLFWALEKTEGNDG